MHGQKPYWHWVESIHVFSEVRPVAFMPSIIAWHSPLVTGTF
jgi:hypothetical protein